MKPWLPLLIFLWIGFNPMVQAVDLEPTPEIPRIDSVETLKPQPQETDAETIWFDDFDGPEKKYTEATGALDDREAFGGAGRALLNYYEKGKQGVGNRKVFFGDSPAGNVIQKGKHFEEIYWRVYIKNQYGWSGGGPDKLSRATSIVSPNWAQAMISHVWSSGEFLTLDPASGVQGNTVVTTKYNDFDHLHWLGNKPASRFPLFSTGESGRWICVEARARLNTPEQKDGLNQLWIDGRLEAERTRLDWRGGYTEYGINAVFLEAYWNQGSPVTQSRWIDNYIISPKPIGPVVCSRNPTLIKTPYRGPGKPQAWEVEIADDAAGTHTVWRSQTITTPERVRIGGDTGKFFGALSGENLLEADQIYFIRVRQQNDAGVWSAWSLWHQPFKTAIITSKVSDG